MDDTALPPQNSEPGPQKKSLFETVVTSTPVMLTVIATFILGQSSSEMTKAQYQRSAAGQMQSKVGDQWAFFQAKRIRGEMHATTVDLLLALKAEPFTRDTLIDAAQNLRDEIEASLKLELPGNAKLVELAKEAVDEQVKIQTVLNPPNDGIKKDRVVLTPETVRAAIDAMVKYPELKQDDTGKRSIDPRQKELLDALLDDIRQFKPEKEIASKSLAISAETIEIAIERAKARAARASEHGRSIERVIAEFDSLIVGQDKIARTFQHIARAKISAMVKANADPDAVQKLERRLDRVRGVLAKLQGDFKAARHTFTGFRYEDDARSNQESAFLYEVKVLQSSARSDRHLARSFGFMIAMLVAQVGVTIASVAIAMRRRVPWWLLAVVAGLSAITFAAYVFLELGPLVGLS